MVIFNVGSKGRKKREKHRGGDTNGIERGRIDKDREDSEGETNRKEVIQRMAHRPKGVVRG